MAYDVQYGGWCKNQFGDTIEEKYTPVKRNPIDFTVIYAGVEGIAKYDNGKTFRAAERKVNQFRKSKSIWQEIQ